MNDRTAVVVGIQSFLIPGREGQGWAGDSVSSRLAPILVDEIIRAQAEDAEYPVIQAKARAKALGENYNPEKHGPFAPPIAPGTAKRFLQESEAALEVSPSEKFAELLEEWKNRRTQLTLMEGL